jgi:hypothetical protein
VAVSVEDLGKHGQYSLTVRVELGCGLLNGAADGLKDVPCTGVEVPGDVSISG